MPDLRGLSARDAVKRLVALGIRPRMNGKGFVVDQRPEMGASLEQAIAVRAVAGARAAGAAAGSGDAAVTIADLLERARGRRGAGPRRTRCRRLSVARPPPASCTTRARRRRARCSWPSAASTPTAARSRRRRSRAARPSSSPRSRRAPTCPRPWVQVADARLALALLADRFFGHPSGDLSVVGITGTNGKTTTAYLLRAAFEAAGHRCGLMGTVTYSLGDEEREATRTTPEAPDMQAMLREMADRGCRAAVMEVSSHALALRRVDGTRFAAGVFTNLTRDHLDFHGDMEAYAAAKRRLFEMLPDGAPGRRQRRRSAGAAMFIEAARQPVTYGCGGRPTCRRDRCR